MWLVVYIGLFHQHKKSFCEKHQHRQWPAVFVDVWSLTFFTPFAGLTNGRIFVFLPWCGPQVGDPPPLFATFGSSSTEACCCCCCCCCCFCCCCSSSSSSNWSSISLASAPDWSHCQQPEIQWWLPPQVWLFPSHCSKPTMVCLLYRLLSMTGHHCRNQMPQRYELLPQWQQNRSKATIWLQYKVPDTRGFPRCF